MKKLMSLLLAVGILVATAIPADAWYRGGYYGYRGGYYGGWGGYGAAAGIGLGLGILGGAIASQQYYNGYNYYYGYPYNGYYGGYNYYGYAPVSPYYYYGW